ncbi:hypothetical protein SAV14893_074640 [Streptomyces avermitilis]|uniref:Uncharacterized protein n=1 Tax=Streptomyces avermitilis TaxID=33903 RepID=A0A4D4M7Y0_STRAX|nr:hypothetical protein SAV14893_074640 [Streptomyces avermitilis]
MRCTDLLEQSAGVRCDGLEVPALGLGVQRAEGERRLARTGDPGEGDHRVPRNIDVDVPQIVLAGAPDMHEVVGRVVLHGASFPESPYLQPDSSGPRQHVGMGRPPPSSRGDWLRRVDLRRAVRL